MNEQKQSLSIPVAIIIAGALIAGGIYFSGRGNAAPSNPNLPPAVETSVPEVTSEDHILGDRNAKVVIVEYSDTECPFCKQFHNTLNQLMKEYGSNSDLAWVYRHFPIPQLHEKAQKEAEALECAAEQGGNTTFWRYTNRLYEITPSNDGLDSGALVQIATEIGLDLARFNSCLDSGKYTEKVDQQRTDALGAGARGTPYSVIFAGGEKIPLTQGALPYADMKNIIDAILKNS